MNYHYIDYMVKERQREVLEECERRRMLLAAGYDDPGIVVTVAHQLTRLFSSVAARFGWGKRDVLIPTPVIRSVACKTGEQS